MQKHRKTLVGSGRPASLDGLVFLLCGLLTGVLCLPQARLFFWSSGWRWVYILGLSFGVAFCLNPLLGRIARRIGALDYPDTRKHHRQATPLLGGASVYLAFLIALVTNGVYSRNLPKQHLT